MCFFGILVVEHDAMPFMPISSLRKPHPDDTTNACTGLRVVAVLGLWWLFGAAAASASLTWVRFDDPTCVGGRVPAEAVLGCGSFGTFVFENEDSRSDLEELVARSGDTCAPGANGSEQPPVVTGEELPPAAGWVPCEDGSCFSESPIGDWVAVIDWQSLHGRSVAHTILEASPYPLEVALFDLAEPGVTEIATLERIGDAHVLAQLCGVAEAAEEKPPLAINMSFGRLYEPGGEPCSPADGRLECQLEALLAHLAGEYGIVAFSAAGNHGQLTFPAAAHEVLSVGSLDAGRFSPRGVATPAFSSPAGVDGLFPGYGLVLEPRATEPDQTTSDGATPAWAPPPGSSYASAFATGWVVGYGASIGSLSFLDLASIDLHPTPVGNDFALELNGAILPGSQSPGARRLLEIAIGVEPLVFDRLAPGQGSSTFFFAVEDAAGTASAPGPSLTTLNGTSARPSPDSAPCVPCRLQRRRLREMADQDRVVLELAGSGGVPLDVQLLDVVLVVGEQRFVLGGTSYQQALVNGYFDFLDALERGEVKEVVLSGLPDLEGRSLALEYRLLRDDGEHYWDSTPIAMHVDVERRLFGDGFELGGTVVWSVSD